MTDSRLPLHHPDRTCAAGSVRTLLLIGIFKRILLIELVLLISALIWRGLYEGSDLRFLIEHSLRVTLLIIVTTAVVTLSLRQFLNRTIIHPLEAISRANADLDIHARQANAVPLPECAADEIVDIVETRRRMLDDLFRVSAERLRLAELLRDTFGRYLSRKVVDEILDSPNGHDLGGRKETVTILMADLRGFTKMTEIQDAQKTVRFLNHFFEAMTQIILRHDGMIDEFLGDGILTIFGVPEKHPDDAGRAVACALEMQNRIAALNRDIAAEGYPPVAMGIGINTGTVIVGNIGSKLRAKYGIVGRAVNVAGRIESVTPSGQVWINESTYRLVTSLVQVDSPQTLMVKGLSQPVVCYPVRSIAGPYQVELAAGTDQGAPVEIQIPLTCWVMDDKKVVENGIAGETIHVGREILLVALQRPLRPHTQVKLQFDFCTEAHCFDPIYASLEECDNRSGRPIVRLRITDIHPADSILLNQWIAEAA